MRSATLLSHALAMIVLASSSSIVWHARQRWKRQQTSWTRDCFDFHCFFFFFLFSLVFSLSRFNFFYSHFRFHWNAKNVSTTIMTMICEILHIICASMLADAHRSLMYLFKIIKHSYDAVIRRWNSLVLVVCWEWARSLQNANAI